MKTLFCFLLLSVSFQTWGQSYSIDWYKISGGGGTSTNGPFALSGTIGQPDASGAMTGGEFSLTGGFWSLVAVVQTAGGPTLFISGSGSSLKVYWQNTGTWTLQQNPNLSVPSGWVNSGGVISSNGTNSIAINNPTGKLFFRLKQ